MNSIGIAAASVLLALSAVPAHADWSYIKWGMTKKAAVAASKGEAHAESGPNIVCAFNSQTPFATIPRKMIGGFTFQVTLCTEGSDKVTSVALSPSEGTNLPALRSALVSQYGQPTIVNGTDTWNDRKAGNTISYSEIGGVVARIEYKKMGGAGL
jgi:hypothetical protein